MLSPISEFTSRLSNTRIIADPLDSNYLDAFRILNVHFSMNIR